MCGFVSIALVSAALGLAACRRRRSCHLPVSRIVAVYTVRLAAMQMHWDNKTISLLAIIRYFDTQPPCVLLFDDQASWETGKGGAGQRQSPAALVAAKAAQQGFATTALLHQSDRSGTRTTPGRRACSWS